MSNSSSNIDRESLLAARMQGDSQDGFSSIGFSSTLPVPQTASDHELPQFPSGSHPHRATIRPGTPLDAPTNKYPGHSVVLESKPFTRSDDSDYSGLGDVDDRCPSTKRKKIDGDDDRYASPMKARRGAITNYFTRNPPTNEIQSPGNNPHPYSPARIPGAPNTPRSSSSNASLTSPTSLLVSPPQSVNAAPSPVHTSTPAVPPPIPPKAMAGAPKHTSSVPRVAAVASLRPTATLTPHQSSSSVTATASAPPIASSTATASLDLSSLPPAIKPMFLAEITKIKEALAESFRVKQRDLETQLAQAQSQCMELQQELGKAEERAQQKAGKALDALVDTLRALAAKQRRETELSLHERRRTLGHMVVVHDQLPPGIANEDGMVWHDGEKLREAHARMKALVDERTEVESLRKKLQKVKTAVSKKVGHTSSSNIDDEIMGLLEDSGVQLGEPKSRVLVGPRPTGAGGYGQFEHMTAMELLEADEVYKLRLNNIKRDITQVQSTLDDLEQQKTRLVKEEQLFLDEALSRFAGYPVIDGRYAFLNMLGKGGFSEVYRAFDLHELRYVACKIHQLNPQWSEERRRSYLKHVMRESKIQKSLNHPKVVSLNDVFKIDATTLVTVLDLCEDGDLDMYLKVHDTLPEKEARVIMWQIFSGLRYLNEQKQRIIHYDLKPANILFHKGEAKITDFGLAKEMQESKQSIELTSQGAGTLSYLPPECFITSHIPLITSAVDVWSCGIIYYQMLFGKRPFNSPHHSAELMAKSHVDIDFPSKPVVSEASKDFIRRCLSINPAERPDILNIFEDPFFKSLK